MPLSVSAKLRHRPVSYHRHQADIRHHRAYLIHNGNIAERRNIAGSKYYLSRRKPRLNRHHAYHDTPRLIMGLVSRAEYAWTTIE